MCKSRQRQQKDEKTAQEDGESDPKSVPATPKERKNGRGAPPGVPFWCDAGKGGPPSGGMGFLDFQ